MRRLHLVRHAPVVAAGDGTDAMNVWSSLRLPDRIALKWPGLHRADG